jgi:two-component system, chemotaxis family, chemotaxis protein CheY
MLLSEKTRVLIVDDWELIRKLLDRSLTEAQGVEVCGHASNGLEAVEKYRELKPDVVILDISMPGMSGVEVLETIRKHDRSTMIVMFTADPSAELRDRCLAAGADHFLSKDNVSKIVEICETVSLAH